MHNLLFEWERSAYFDPAKRLHRSCYNILLYVFDHVGFSDYATAQTKLGYIRFL